MLDLRGNALAIEWLECERPLQRDGLWNITLVVVASLIAKRTFEDHLAVLVQNPEGANDFGIGVRKQRISNMLSVRKVREHGDAVIADRSQPQALSTDIAEMMLQLDELGFAKRSPVDRTVKNQ